MKKVACLMILSIFAAVIFAGCQNVHQSKIKDEPLVIDNIYKNMKPASSPPPGTIFRGVNSSSSVLSDHRARAIGDIITIVISERTTASEKAGTATKRTSTTTAGIPNFFGLESQIPSGIASDKLINANTKNDFDGSGQTTRDGTLTATITARVVDVLPNGNLVIEGKREIVINEEKKEILVQGIVRPRDLDYNNSVQSSMIADAKIIYTGVGVLAEKQRPGWLARVVDAIWPF